MERNINRDKLNNYAEQVAARLCDKFFDNGKQVSGQEILRFSEIEQLNLLILKNLYLKWNEESRALKSPYFDYDSDAVKRAMKDFLNVLSRNISVGRDAFQPILVTSIEELVVLVSDFKAYMQHFVIDRNVSVEMVEGTTKFYKIHARPFRLSSSMLSKSRHPDTNSIPSSFLPEKEEEQKAYDEVMVVLEQILPLREDIFAPQDFSKGQAPRENVISGDTDAPLSNPAKPAIPRDEIRSRPTHSDHTDTAAQKSERTEADVSSPAIGSQYESESKQPLEKDIVSENAESDVDNLSFDSAHIEKQSTPFVLNDRFHEQKESLADRHRSLKGESLPFPALSLNQKFMFINQLFKGNTQEFEHSLDMIESSRDFQDALGKVKAEYADRYGWNFENDEESEFLELISRSFK